MDSNQTFKISSCAVCSNCWWIINLLIISPVLLYLILQLYKLTSLESNKRFNIIDCYHLKTWVWRFNSEKKFSGDGKSLAHTGTKKWRKEIKENSKTTSHWIGGGMSEKVRKFYWAQGQVVRRWHDGRLKGRIRRQGGISRGSAGFTERKGCRQFRGVCNWAEARSLESHLDEINGLCKCSCFLSDPGCTVNISHMHYVPFSDMPIDIKFS